jgi:hypothetical protein
MSNPNSDRASVSANTASDIATEKLLAELKTRARLRLNALSDGDPEIVKHAHWISKKRRWPIPPEWKLQHAFNIVATQIGFRDWEQARRVLSGLAKPGDDMGGFWYDFGCELLLNNWFANYDEAKAFHRQANERWLFPYAKQFVVGETNFIKTLLLDPALPQWEQVNRDLFASYGNAHWQQLCAARLSATRGLPPPTPGRY